MEKIAITTSTFGQFDETPIEILRDKGFTLAFNTQGKTMPASELVALLKGCSGVIAGTEPYDKGVLDQVPSLRLISRCGVGTDKVDLPLCQQRGIKVTTTPLGPTLAVAELVIGQVMCLLRNIPLMDRQVREGIWKKQMGRLLAQKQFGVIGMGRIGQEVARLAAALGAQVAFYDPQVEPSGDFAHIPKRTLPQLLAESDIVTLHVPYSEATRHLIGAPELAQMKSSALLINSARGGIVREDALYTALKEGKLSGAALDVFEGEPYSGPLTDLDNCLLTPHIGSYAREARVQMETAAVKNLINGLNDLKRR